MIKVEWADDKKNVIFWKFTGPWTWGEFYDAQKQAHVMVEDTDGIVDSIFLFTKDQQIPLGAITHFRNLAKRAHRRHDMVILLGPNRFLTALLRTFTHVLPSFSQHLHFVGSKAEAYTMIAEAEKKRAANNSEQHPASMG